MYKVTVKQKGDVRWILKYLKVKNKLIMEEAARILAAEIIDHSIRHYLERRKSEDPVSMIVNSFGYKLNAGDTKFVLDVISGGTTAPHAKFVEYPRKGFTGYGFMKAGAEYARTNSRRIVKEQISKHLRGK
jgi:hypothetical protein